MIMKDLRYYVEFGLYSVDYRQPGVYEEGSYMICLVYEERILRAFQEKLEKRDWKYSLQYQDSSPILVMKSDETSEAAGFELLPPFHPKEDKLEEGEGLPGEPH